MKIIRTIGLGILSVAAAGVVTGAPAEEAEGTYGPLRAALGEWEEEAIAEAREALIMAREYEEFLKDPDTETDEKPELRKIVFQEESHHRKLRKEAIELRAAVDELRNVPPGDELTLEALKQAYDGLGDLGQRGRAAWEDLLARRAATVARLEAEYARELEVATVIYESLDTAARANELLLGSIDPRRSGATAEEFEVALRLPRVKSAVELGFGISARPDDEDAQAQAALVALVGYAQFFWDYYTDARTELADGGLPRDAARNVLGVVGGGVLLSDAVVENHSNYYYLSAGAKENFNGRLRSIWGPERKVTITWWDQKTAASFQRACESLSTTADGSLVPNDHAFVLLELIDGMVEEKRFAEEKIASIHLRYREEIASAQDFGDRAALSSASFNALLWDREAERTMARFESARRLLDAQLAACLEDDWTPKPKGIAASAKALKQIQKRLYAVVNVKEELAKLLEF